MKSYAFCSVAVILAFGVSGCGQRGDLVRSAGESGPSTPAGEAVAPTAGQLTTASTQARPQRSDEVLRKSEERQSDEYDLPPEQ